MSFRLSAVVEHEDDWFVSHCVELGLASQGKTVEEALANLREACQLYLKHADQQELARLKKITDTSPLLSTISV